VKGTILAFALAVEQESGCSLRRRSDVWLFSDGEVGVFFQAGMKKLQSDFVGKVLPCLWKP